MTTSDAVEAIKNVPPVAAGVAQLSGAFTLPDVVSFLTAIWLAALLIERVYRGWCWWVARRSRLSP